MNNFRDLVPGIHFLGISHFENDKNYFEFIKRVTPCKITIVIALFKFYD
jgi:hypothetical protein